MLRAVLPVALVFALLLSRAPLQGAAPADRIWFCPGPGTIDYARLFEHPDEWAHARALVSVFKFYQQHTQVPADPTVGPNSYDALARAGAFRLPSKWGMRIAIEAGAVKDFYCTQDASGMAASIDASVASLRAVEAAGGKASYLAMDEPWVSGREKVCGGPALEPTADRVAQYVRGVASAAPYVRIGLIEAYPFSSADQIDTMLQLLEARGVKPAFLHMDVDLAAMRPPDDFTRDMRRLRERCAARDIPFGIIIWGNNGDADVLYALDAERLVDAISSAFNGWDDMPDQLILQSWAESRTGLRITPANLSERDAFTHTNLLWSVYRRLRGAVTPPAGTAVTRK